MGRWRTTLEKAYRNTRKLGTSGGKAYCRTWEDGRRDWEGRNAGRGKMADESGKRRIAERGKMEDENGEKRIAGRGKMADETG